MPHLVEIYYHTALLITALLCAPPPQGLDFKAMMGHYYIRYFPAPRYADDADAATTRMRRCSRHDDDYDIDGALFSLLPFCRHDSWLTCYLFSYFDVFSAISWIMTIAFCISHSTRSKRSRRSFITGRFYSRFHLQKCASSLVRPYSSPLDILSPRLTRSFDGAACRCLRKDDASNMPRAALAALTLLFIFACYHDFRHSRPYSPLFHAFSFGTGYTRLSRRWYVTRRYRTTPSPATLAYFSAASRATYALASPQSIFGFINIGFRRYCDVDDTISRCCSHSKRLLPPRSAWFRR